MEENKSDMEKTMILVKELGDKLVSGIKLAIDVPEYHDYRKCLMLDIQV